MRRTSVQRPSIGIISILLVVITMTGCAGSLFPLHTAAGADGNIVKVRELLAQGADVNAKGRADRTPLMTAAYYGNFEIAQLLIEKGADIETAIVSIEDVYSDKSAARAGKNWLLQYQAALLSQKPATDETPVRQKQGVSSTTLAATSDVDELPESKGKLNRNAYAIVIGIESYRQKLPKADFAIHDAQTVTAYLTKTLGFPEENVVTLTNDRAALGDFAKYFEKWLPNNVEKGGTVFIYYSGHGAPNTKTGDAYLVPYDGDPAFIDETGYSLKRMYDSLGKLPAKSIVVALDSCFSGAGGRSVIAKGTRSITLNLKDQAALPRNMTVLAASSGEQTSSTYDEKGHGLFTYFLLKGIKNEDVVAPDGSLRLDDLFAYIQPQVERVARKQFNNEQTPQLIGK